MVAAGVDLRPRRAKFHAVKHGRDHRSEAALRFRHRALLGGIGGNESAGGARPERGRERLPLVRRVQAEQAHQRHRPRQRLAMADGLDDIRLGEAQHEDQRALCKRERQQKQQRKPRGQARRP